MLKDIDIPKLYFNETQDGTIEIVDGQQRLWAIWEFVDGTYPYVTDASAQRFAELSSRQRDTIKGYTLQVAIFDDADDDYLRELFLRLQLGLLLVTGEKLHVATGVMKDFIFDKLAKHSFIVELKIQRRRYALETLCAQIAINSFTRAKVQSFARTRYEDLLFFFRTRNKTAPPDRRKGHRPYAGRYSGRLWLSRCSPIRCGTLSNRSCRFQPVDPKADGRAFRIVRV